MRITKTPSFLALTVLLALLLASCTATPAPVVSETPASVPAAQAIVVATDTPPPAAPATLAPTEARSPTATLASIEAPSPVVEPTATSVPVPVEPTLAPAPELSLAESLAAAFTTAPTAAGDVILVTGRVLDLSGNPLPGAAVEFWQTDASGVYDHPGDRSTASRDRGFQFYGTSIADSDGRYLFRTVQPGYYEPRPRHIHVKVKLDGRTLLTTQFYFEEDVAVLGNEGLFAQAGSLGSLLILQTMDSVDVDGSAVALLSNDLVVSTGSPGSLTATPAQGEGPYYPVVSVANFDNDLAVAP